MPIQRKRRSGKIHKWKPGRDENLVEQDGKLFVCYFDKIFGIEKLSQYNRFVIRKDSYVNQLPTITKYINFFEKYYDIDRELPTAYLKIKFALDKQRLYDENSMDAYIDFVYEILFRDSIVDKIYAFIEDNYIDDIDATPEEKKKFLKGDKAHLESLEFTNEHVKGLLRISMGMKIMAPALFHYTQLNNIIIRKDDDIIFRFYQNLFDIFKYSNEYDLMCLTEGSDEDELIRENIKQAEFEDMINSNFITIKGEGRDIEYHFVDLETGENRYLRPGQMNLFNKLYVYVRTKILQSNANNSLIFGQREIFGQDLYTVIDSFVRRVIISENAVKYLLPSEISKKTGDYVESVVGFNKTMNLTWQNRVTYWKNLFNCWEVLNNHLAL